MAYFVKDTAVCIVGTSEKVSATYPIAPDPDNPNDWTYTGGPSKIFEEASEFAGRNPLEPCFLGENGQNYPWSAIEWRDHAPQPEEFPT